MNPQTDGYVRAQAKRQTAKQSSILSVAGGVLLANSLATLALAFYGERSAQPEVLMQKLSIFVAQSPSLLLGFCLLFWGREGQASMNSVPWRVTRTIPFILLLFYLATIPISGVLSQGLKDRLETRLQNVLQQGRIRGNAIESDLESLNSTPQILAALKTYPEISNIDIPVDMSPVMARSAVAKAITEGIKAQQKSGNREIAQALKSQSAAVRSIVVSAIIASIGFLGLSSILIPWVQDFTRALVDLSSGFLGIIRSFLFTAKNDLRKAAAPSPKQQTPRRRSQQTLVSGLVRELGGGGGSAKGLFSGRGRSKSNKRRR